jgi:radical SAM superfamily enzyme YgiQ (UPF0313 family)
MLKKKSSIKLLQLPIPEVHHLYTEGNIPLAAGYLKAAALKKGAADHHEIEIIPRDMANHAGDAAILKWILQEDTAIVGFTSYMWNIDRNTYLAGKIKEQNPEVKIIFGGPEIDRQHPALKNNHINAFVIGEGELAFADIIKDFKNGKELERSYQSEAPVDLKEVPNPYLEKILVPFQDESMFLETMRGCPYLCKYCFYSKSFSRLRFFPGENLPELFALARDYNVPEIYLMDPSFNVTPGLKERLELIRRVNSTAIPIHTEIRLESVTPEIARLMKEAGFHSVEAGLQSVNKKSLEAIGRQWNREKFIQGAKHLQEQGIDVKTGVILGLPYDNLQDFERTLDFVMDLNLAESMEIYPLSLIPGTLLRDEAETLGITYMPHPPYWVLSTKYMGEKEIKAAVEMVEHKLEIEFFPPIIPRFENLDPAYNHFLDLRQKAGCQLNALYRYPERVGHSLTILMDEKNDINQMMEFGQWIRKVSPFTLVQLVMEWNTIPVEKDLRWLSDAFYHPHHYFNPIHHYKMDRQGQYSLRFFHLTDNLDMAESYLYQPLYCDLVLRYTSKLLERGRDILEEKPVLLVDSPIAEGEVGDLKRIYDGFENFLVFVR